MYVCVLESKSISLTTIQQINTLHNTPTTIRKYSDSYGVIYLSLSSYIAMSCCNHRYAHILLRSSPVTHSFITTYQLLLLIVFNC